MQPFITPEQFQKLIQLIAEPYATMVYVAVYTGLRASELVGLRCESISDRTHLPPKDVDHRREGREGRRAHYRAVKSDGPEDLVFQLVSRNALQCANNILFKHIKPAASAVGIGWVNWQVLRRSHATWLGMAGASVKGHASADAALAGHDDARHLSAVCT